MFSRSQRYRIGYILIALALLGVGLVYMWNAQRTQASEILSFQCTSCHTTVPITLVFSTEPCDACHDEAPRPDRVVSPAQAKRDLIALQSHFAAFWDNPLQKLDSRFHMAMDQLWQAETLLVTANTQDNLLVVEDLIAQAEAALAQLENEATWGFWQPAHSPKLPREAVTSDTPFPIPLMAHTLWDSAFSLKPPSDYGPNLELVGLLVVSLCLLMVALRRAPPDDSCNAVFNINVRFRPESRHCLTLSVFICTPLYELVQPSHRTNRLKEVTPQKNVLMAQYKVMI